jgi:hypothetical protein
MLFTFGYRGQRVPDLDWFTTSWQGNVIDIRMSPKSVRPEWGGGALHGVLGDRYIHVPELGNRNYANGGEIDIADMDAGLAAVDRFALFGATSSCSVILMCGCRDLVGCHRNIVAPAVSALYKQAANELRFTWTKNTPMACPVCHGGLSERDRGRIVPDQIYELLCGHMFVWRPNKEASIGR